MENNTVIGIASSTYMDDGDIVIHPVEADIRENTRRVNRSKTLDGYCVITDSGYCEGDRTFKILTQSTKAIFDKIWLIFKTALLCNITTDEGCFSGAIQNVRDQGDTISVSVLIKEKLSE